MPNNTGFRTKGRDDPTRSENARENHEIGEPLSIVSYRVKFVRRDS